VDACGGGGSRAEQIIAPDNTAMNIITTVRKTILRGRERGASFFSIYFSSFLPHSSGLNHVAARHLEKQSFCPLWSNPLFCHSRYIVGTTG
jgi:hypothetical protein